jgi:hypothetical protein
MEPGVRIVEVELQRTGPEKTWDNRAAGGI